MTERSQSTVDAKETFHLPSTRAKVRRGSGPFPERWPREVHYVTTVDGKHFGNRLREARLRAGFSQSELEDLSGIPKARLSRYENGHVEPSIQTLARLARALDVSEASLLGDQRATLEGFFDVLSARGVRIESAEQGVRLANAVADMVNALGGMGSFVGEVDLSHDAPIHNGSDPVSTWAEASANTPADV